MTCPNCGSTTEPLKLDGHAGAKVDIDACRACHAFWFDALESVQLAPASTLRLFTFIGETPSARKALTNPMRCPRCRARLKSTKDLQRTTSFHYWRCDRGHGRFITFFDFLREKDFVRPMSRQQIEELRATVQFVNCSNCGGPVDLAERSSCAHCGTPLSILDSKHAEGVVAQLKRAADPRPIDPALSLDLARARRQAESAFLLYNPDSWKELASSDLVEAGLNKLMAWLKKP